MMQRQTINWSTLSDKTKTQHIIENVMQWTCFERWEDAEGDGHWHTVSQYTGITDPVAFWNEVSGRWSISYYNQAKSIESFDPLHNMNDAWLVVEKINAGNFTLERIVTPPVEQQAPYTLYSEKPFFYEAAFYLGANWLKTTQTYHNQGETPAEAICIAALRSVGIQIEIEVPS